MPPHRSLRRHRVIAGTRRGVGIGFVGFGQWTLLNSSMNSNVPNVDRHSDICTALMRPKINLVALSVYAMKRGPSQGKYQPTTLRDRFVLVASRYWSRPRG